MQADLLQPMDHDQQGLDGQHGIDLDVYDTDDDEDGTWQDADRVAKANDAQDTSRFPFKAGRDIFRQDN